MTRSRRGQGGFSSRIASVRLWHMNKTAVEPRLSGPTLWTHLSSGLAAFFGKHLIGRPRHGAVSLTLPNGKSVTFGNPATGEHARLHIRNFKVIIKNRP